MPPFTFTLEDSMHSEPIIEMNKITKSFPGVIANQAISFSVNRGEIHALLGENGAGKSTLMSILAGLYRPDAGIIKISGQPVKFKSPRDALECGVGMIYQHFRLVNNFTVAQNIILGTAQNHFYLNPAGIEQTVLKLSQKYGFDINPSARVNQLSIGERQRVEILKMLYRGCNILIMDEPTTVLTPQEVDELFKVLRLMADQGKTIILITHKLNEVMKIADRVTVLRKGQVVGSDSIENVDADILTHMMVEHEVVYHRLQRGGGTGSRILELSHLEVPGDQGYLAVKGVELTIYSGEIVGVAGVAGNGQRELVEAIAGLRKPSKGSISLKGEDITRLGVRDRLNRGINMVPEDRIGMGLVPNLNIMDNSILRSYYTSEFISRGLLDYKKVSAYTEGLVRDFNIFAPNINHPVNFLSGGNLQKLLLGREIRQAPKVLVASYPVRGLDIAASEAVFKLLLDERNKGTAILLVLEDLDDIFRLADRVAVMYDGLIKAVMPVEDTDIDKIGALMLGAQEMRDIDAQN